MKYLHNLEQHCVDNMLAMKLGLTGYLSPKVELDKLTVHMQISFFPHGVPGDA